MSLPPLYGTGVVPTYRPAGSAEESKVKLKKPVSLAWRPQKRGANRVAHFLRSVFQRASPSSVRRRLAASLVLEFTGTSRAVADRTGAAIVICASASLMFDRLQHLLRKRQIESSRRPKRFSQTVPCLVAIQFSHHLLHRPSCRQAPLNRLLQALRSEERR